MARVSVIIPAYNASATIREALMSIKSQTFTDWEAVVVNDGSKDDTAAVVESCAAELGGRLVYVYQENKGLPAARNTAIRNASGELFALLDSDDVWLPTRLELGIAVMDRDRSIGLVHGRQARIGRQSEVIGEMAAAAHQVVEGNIATDIYTRRAHLHCPTILFRRECVDKAGLFDETMRATEDRDMWFRIACHYKVGFVNEIVAHYRISPNQMSSDWARMFKAQSQFIEKHRASGAASALDARAALAQIYRERGDFLFKTASLGQALEFYGKSLRTYPFSASNAYMFMRALADPLLTRAGVVSARSSLSQATR